MTYPRSTLLDGTGRAPERPETLVSLLRRRAASEPDASAYAFLGEAGEITCSLTRGELDRHARHVGALLQSLGAQGSRAMILLPPGIEFVAAFFGCLYAGAVAVAAPLPCEAEGMDRTRRLIRDSGSRFILTSAAERERMASLFGDEGLTVLAPFAAADDLADDWALPLLEAGSLACLQYSSSAAGTLRGVMLSHGNLLHNLRVLRSALDLGPGDRLVSWLAPYHELGMVLGILAPLESGSLSCLLDPAAVLEEPGRWPRAISCQRATVTFAPNFGYDLCVRRIPAAERSGFDLKSLRLTLNGGEPVQARTLAEFTHTFAAYGFDPAGFQTFYALAEATLLVSGGDRSRPAVVGLFDRAALERGSAGVGAARTGRLVAGSGRPRPGQLVRIVNPETGRSRAAGEVGEIWIAGPSVSAGYWRRRAETMESFGAFVRDTGEGPFLRSGDLGFLLDGELFVTGRLAPGQGSSLSPASPAEIEAVASASHELLQPGGAAAFSLSSQPGGAVVIALEADTIALAVAGIEEVSLVVRTAVSRTLGVQIDEVLLLPPGSLPRTPIGKVRRAECRRLYLDGAFGPAASGRNPGR